MAEKSMVLLIIIVEICKKQFMAKKINNLSPFGVHSCLCAFNPWTKITWNNTIADCDKNTITTFTQNNPNILDTSDLPEPYSGSFINSDVICLNLNPGGTVNATDFKQSQYLQLRQETLLHKTDDFMWFKDIKDINGNLHAGCIWWRERTKELCTELNTQNLNIFVLEYFPYHSKQSFNYPELPSDAYRDYLLFQALIQGKLLVIMRGKRYWEKVLLRTILRLCSYRYKIIEMNSPQSAFFSKNNFGSNWRDLIKTLS
ncbi:hypothetical protein C7Y71_004995 [Pseudoprevotella muciniphila]|uniref:Uncharacterized protein n=1 Tax=Pseudoprevotella muciniphila TaxID=2133944 RepID=A0A5P8E5Z1_9BACT|nr:hypothetical protein [Pseudoprevotella muciniphila]QFQ12423.1 hypothetical protein C7Y71_004995 [Pseudoprevotella muciniphila]